MSQDATGEARSVLEGLFSGIGQHAQGQAPAAPAGLNVDWMIGQFTELIEMPLDLAQIFMGMSVELTELVLRALEEAGISLVHGLTPM